MRRSLLACLVAALVAVTTGCQLRAEVLVDVLPDGSGSVTVTVALDPAAARRLGDPAAGLQLDDLRAAGWDVEEPATAPDGAVTISGRRAFGAPDQLPAVLDEIGGPDGVFRDVRLEVRDGFGSAEYRFSAEVNLTGSPEQFSDPELAAALDGLLLARTPEELDAAGADDPTAAVLEVSVVLPGGDPTTDGTAEQRRSTWSFPMTGGEPTREQISSRSTASRGRTGALLGVAVVAMAAAAVAATVGILRRRS